MTGGGVRGIIGVRGGADRTMSNVSLPLRPAKLSYKERVRLSHEIATDFPLKKPGDRFGYENRNHFYIVRVREFGSYSFEARIALTKENKPYIDLLRKGLSENGE